MTFARTVEVWSNSVLPALLLYVQEVNLSRSEKITFSADQNNEPVLKINDGKVFKILLQLWIQNSSAHSSLVSHILVKSHINRITLRNGIDLILHLDKWGPEKVELLIGELEAFMRAVSVNYKQCIDAIIHEARDEIEDLGATPHELNSFDPSVIHKFVDSLKLEHLKRL